MIRQPPDLLVVSATNPRYFATPTAAGAPEKLIYLTGSHVNNNLHDGLGPGCECPDNPEQFDFDAYLGVLSRSVVIISFASGAGSSSGAIWRQLMCTSA